MVYEKLRSNSGFTLLESLVVLLVVSVVLLFGMITVNPMMEWVQKKMFVSQLRSDLYYAHSHAIQRKERVSVSFSQESSQYTATGDNTGVLFIRDLPPPVKITGGSLKQLRLHITPDGTINNFGIVNFALNDQSIELTFHIGRGRFDVKE